MDVFQTFFGQVPQLTQKFSIAPPDILGNISIMGTNGAVGSITTGVHGEAIVHMHGEKVATIRDSVYGNYEVETAQGTFTAMDNAVGGETLFQFGQPIATSREGIFNTESWYSSATGDKLFDSAVDGFGQTTITVPAQFDSHTFPTFDFSNQFTSTYDLADFTDVFSHSSDFFDFLDWM